MSSPLQLAVVGHTNTGKTSLLRTLLRDSAFGEVRHAPATTRHVEAAEIADGGQALVTLYDTPGLEDAGGVLDWLEEHTSARVDGVERLQSFLASPEAAGEFAQEAKVLRQLLRSDMALYVVDAREPVLPKYKDELTVLSWCAKPLMPVFNFIQGQDVQAWSEMLARRGLHVWSGFDTVAFDFEGEIRLWNNLATMLPERTVLDRLTDLRRREWAALDREARQEIAHFLLDMAAYAVETDAEDDPEPHLRSMQQEVRAAEAAFQQRLFRLYRFYQDEHRPDHDWVLQPFHQDPFDSELLKEYGIRTTKGAATGALIGLGVDVLTLGTSFGLGTTLGGLIGGVLPNVQTLSDTFSGRQRLHIAPETLTLLAARALALLSVLQTRGHAAQTAVGSLPPRRAPWSAERLPGWLGKARRRPQWSAFNGYSEEAARQARSEAAAELAGKLTVTA